MGRIIGIILGVLVILGVQRVEAQSRTPSGETQLHINPNTYVELYCNNEAQLIVVTNGESDGYLYCLESSKE